MRKNPLRISLAVCGAIVLWSSAALAADNWLGTWNVDLAKSKYSPGPAPRSLTLKFEATPGGIRFTGDGAAADGTPAHTMYVSRYDGKDVPYEGNPDADMASPRRMDDNSYINTWKKGEKATITSKVVVSADGKTMTITQTGKNAKGEAVNNTIVYNKQ
ncbi:MAG: hypothetical protein M3S32_04780 [Acidobacteriota bacterium]|nr:hypothetical protein [Acidobacteriota bacterium]